MTPHLNAQEGQIAEHVLMPGDPLRAKYIADNFFKNAVCHNTVRGMYGYTGTYKGVKVSVQSSGMGAPSMSIYATEIIKFYGVKNIIRVGTIGAMNAKVKVRDVIIAMAASNDSNINRMAFPTINYAPHASFKLLDAACQVSKEHKSMRVHVGSVFSSDIFYSDDNSHIDKLASYGILGAEMETAALYTLGAKYGINTLSIMTVSNHLITGEETTPEERQTTFNDMTVIALDAFIRGAE